MKVFEERKDLGFETTVGVDEHQQTKKKSPMTNMTKMRLRSILKSSMQTTMPKQGGTPPKQGG